MMWCDAGEVEIVTAALKHRVFQVGPFLSLSKSSHTPNLDNI